MNRLQLATLLSWAGDKGIQGRKRLQKIVYFLQYAGCPLQCQYTLHHFGPYSRDVADACDEMVAAGLIVETGGPKGGSMQYEYSLAPQTSKLLERTVDAQLQAFKSLGTELLTESLWTLELGSTILFFYSQDLDWPAALTKACEFKKVQPEHATSLDSLTLAKRVHESSVHV